MTTEQYQRMLARLTKIEETINDIIVSQSNLVSLQQVQQLLVLTQTEMQDVRETVTALEDRITILEEEPIS